MVDILRGDGEAASLGVLAELAELCLGILAAIDGRDSGIDGSALHAPMVAPSLRSAKRKSFATHLWTDCGWSQLGVQ